MVSALEIKKLEKTYDNSFTALKGIDLSVEQGDFLALLGPNGAGKSTTIGIVCSMINKTSGSVEIFGVDIDKDFPKAKQMVGVVPQEFNFNQFEKVYDILIAQAGYFGISAAKARTNVDLYLKKLGLWDKRNDVSRSLSGGMKRRLMIARALVHEPKLLILDEPTAGVDIELRRSMWEFLKEINANGTTIILTTHYLEEAELLCRNVAIIDGGAIVENCSMRDLLAQLDSEVFLLDVEAALDTAPTIEGFNCELTDTKCLQVGVQKGQVINDLFLKLSEQGIKVTSLKNQSNRLEELFVSRVEANQS